ncbi:MAG: RNA polymerase sigma factor [Bacteroidota bacterium]|jgi:RNA polymerase sigma factor (sigma-70 family)|nr:sigma-70 family RNA polymerase sigma factor [Cytophagales bacterium]MCE2958187.1 sigma-70 family RNA polymerase sigma factor [Flammeovirgaceae bacterium]
MTPSLKPGEPTDQVLIAASIKGDKKSLELLIKRYQDYIYNISLRLFIHPDDALDATQEVLIKVVTSLKTFRGNAQFSTWLYRIAFNHFLNSPKKKTETLIEENPKAFGSFSEEVDETISEAEVEEVRILCSTAMLMCLNREQRLIYIIGEIFGADHQLGAELFDMTPANFRVKLHRAKTDLLQYISGKCGLVNPKNPCRCNKKARVMIDRGLVDKNNMRFNASFQQSIAEIVKLTKDETCDDIEFRMKELFFSNPFQIKAELDEMLTGIVA